MSDLGLTRTLRLIVSIGSVATSVGVAILFINGEWSVFQIAALVGVGTLGLVVWTLAPSQPRNPLTWVLATSVLFIGAFPLSQGINGILWPEARMPAFEDPIPGGLPTGFLTLNGIAGALGSAGATLLATFGLLLFPDGRLPSKRWRWVAYPAGSAIVIFFLVGAYSALPGNASFIRESIVAEWSYVMLILSVPPCLVAPFVRFRGSEGDTRQQFKWILWGSVVFVFTVLISFLGGPEVLGVIGISMFAATYGIAILKYRLYDIDIVINRTVVLAVLAGFITLVYATVVVGIGNNLAAGDSDGLLFPILATAIVALAFEPVLHRAQGWANRLVYGQRATPYEVLADLTGRLSHGEEGEGLLGRMAKRLGDGTGAERATIWLGGEGDMTIGSSWPIDPESSHQIDLGSDEVFPVTHDGDLVGAFEVIKPRGSVLSTAERSLVDDLAGSAGAVLGYQRLNDSLSEKVDELARSRARLVDAQDRERRRLERDLHDGAQQLIVALKVKIGLARTMAAKHEATELEDLLEGLGNEAQGALEEVRALAKGIYPPVLESDGLASALSALAVGAGDVVVKCEGLRRYERDIEATIYFEISEALTNAVKHASGPIVVEVVDSDSQLMFSVTDSGPGFDVASANGGSGLRNLRDRVDAFGGTLEITSDSGGTVVSGAVPYATVLA